MALDQARKKASVRLHASTDDNNITSIRPLIRKLCKRSNVHTLLLPLLVGIWDRWRLPAFGDHHVGVRESKDSRSIHRRRVRHARSGHCGRRHSLDHCRVHLPQELPLAELRSGSSGLPALASGLRVADHLHVRRCSCCSYVLLSYADA